MAEAEVRVLGLDELASGSRTLADNIQTGAGKAFAQSAEDTASATRLQVPRRSGRLAGSLLAGPPGEVVTVGYDGSVPYAGWIEFGGTRGRPYASEGRYLFPTALAAESALLASAETVAKDEIRGMRWPSPSAA